MNLFKVTRNGNAIDFGWRGGIEPNKPEAADMLYEALRGFARDRTALGIAIGAGATLVAVKINKLWKKHKQKKEEESEEQEDGA